MVAGAGVQVHHRTGDRERDTVSSAAISREAVVFTSGVASRCSPVLGAEGAGQQPRQHDGAQHEHTGADRDQRGVAVVHAAA